MRLDREPDVVVVTAVETEPRLQTDLLRWSEACAPIFEAAPGYLGGAILRSRDGRRLLLVPRWRCEEDHRAALDRSERLEEPGQKWLGPVRRFGMRVETVAYDVAWCGPAAGN